MIRSFDSRRQEMGELEFSFRTARGSYVWDDGEVQYFDLTSGWNVVNAGWSNRQILEAWWECVENLSFRPNWCSDKYRRCLEERLAELAPGYVPVFSCSGGEAIDNALKLARLVTGRGGAISFADAYHGSTTGASLASGFDLNHLDPLKLGIERLRLPPHPDLNDLENMAQTLEWADDIGAVVFETVLTNVGCRVLSDATLSLLEKLSRDFGLITICDEIGTGINRTGHTFSCGRRGIKPHMIVCGKALTNGIYPLSMVLVSSELLTSLDEQSFSSTFGGNAAGCAAALATLAYHDEHELGARSAHLAAEVKARIEENAMGSQRITGVSGEGLELCIHLNWRQLQEEGGLTPSSLLRNLRAKRVFATLSPGEHDLMVMPPLTSDRSELLQAIDRVFDVLV